MSHQDRVPQILVCEDLDDIADVGVQVHLASKEMTALAQACERRAVHLVASVS
jgi:hypothetical protein